MFSKSNKDAGDAGAFRLGDEVMNLVAERIDLDEEANVHAVYLPQLMMRSRIGSQSSVASEIVVGNEEAVDALPLLIVLANAVLDVVGTAFTPPHLDDRSE
jgi:hypothetical protein